MTDQINIIMWTVSGCFALNFGLLLVIWSSLNKIDDKVTDVDRRVCHLQGAIFSKDWCVLKDEKHLRKAE